jgi:predicted component of type VI protein secretion system
MQVLLKIIGGKHAGREIKISVPKFIIGRGDGAHLKPASDMVSRKHCQIEIKDGKVIVSDMGSRNGSFVNGQQLTQPHTARSGDKIRIGRLQFELVIDPVKAGIKKPKIKDAVEAAARTTANANSAKSSSLEDSISDWLVDDGDDSPFDEPDFDPTETLQFSAEETQEFTRKHEEADQEIQQRIDTKGKLPPRPMSSHEDSTDAADDILKKLFNRR